MNPKDLFKGVLFLAVLWLSPTGLYADDTEIYYARADVDDEKNQQIANVLFLIDTSGSMCDPPSGGRDCSNTPPRCFSSNRLFVR